MAGIVVITARHLPWRVMQPHQGQGTWTNVSGTGTITSPNFEKQRPVTGVPVGSRPVQLKWTIVNGLCQTDDDVILYNAPVAAAGDDQ